jgi:hypothetical protein
MGVGATVLSADLVVLVTLWEAPTQVTFSLHNGYISKSSYVTQNQAVQILYYSFGFTA